MQATNCVRKEFGHDSHVCVCNSTFCDTVGTYMKVKVAEAESTLKKILPLVRDKSFLKRKKNYGSYQSCDLVI